MKRMVKTMAAVLVAAATALTGSDAYAGARKNNLRNNGREKMKPAEKKPERARTVRVTTPKKRDNVRNSVRTDRKTAPRSIRNEKRPVEPEKRTMAPRPVERVPKPPARVEKKRETVKRPVPAPVNKPHKSPVTDKRNKKEVHKKRHVIKPDRTPRYNPPVRVVKKRRPPVRRRVVVTVPQVVERETREVVVYVPEEEPEELIEYAVAGGAFSASEILDYTAMFKYLAGTVKLYEGGGYISGADLIAFKEDLYEAIPYIFVEELELLPRWNPKYLFGDNVQLKDDAARKLARLEMSRPEARAFVVDFKRMLELMIVLSTRDLGPGTRTKAQEEYNGLLNEYFEPVD